MSPDALSTLKVNDLLESRKELGHAGVIVAGAAHAMVHDRKARHQLQLVEGLALRDLGIGTILGLYRDDIGVIWAILGFYIKM